jgi:type I restriction enzyme, S subunit
MGGEWLEVSVEEIKAGVENALSTGPFGSSIGSRFFTDCGVPVIRGSNLSEDIGIRLNDNGLVFLSPEKAREFSRATVRDGDLVFTCWGTVNQVGLIDGRAEHREYVISNKQMKLTPDLVKADSLFLYYLFSSPSVQNRIKSQCIGSSVPASISDS